ncbi:hypothetical protein [Leptospira andrefontaineae]|uniref:Uncharacterized protein n=1 Tax=Leptospira andrefontaineae TaxID=2484976 RepID=A0A4R9H6N7_9LEPT|nr:hypothetical protein [Leptospira andrefontaineae]TGK41266.1 hypothetical protein EHO65_07515 [Leptospira andrefontaineae]
MQFPTNSVRKLLLLDLFLVFYFGFNSCSLYLLRNSDSQDRQPITSPQSQKEFGVILIYENNHALNLIEAPFNVKSILEPKISVLGLKLIEVHSDASYSVVVGELKNILVLKVSKFAHRRGWSFYTSLFTLMLIPGFESWDLQIAASLYDSNGKEIPIPAIQSQPVYKQVWLGWPIFPLYWLSEKESMVATNVIKAANTVLKDTELAARISGPIVSDYKIVKSADLDFGTSSVKTKIINVQRVDSYVLNIKGHGGTPRQQRIFTEHPAVEDFLKVTVDFENPSDANADVSPFIFLPEPLFSHTKGPQLGNTENKMYLSPDLAAKIEYTSLDPLNLFYSETSHQKFTLRPQTSAKRIFYFRYLKSKEPIQYKYFGTPIPYQKPLN